jgi:acetyl-CoA acetyltransferase
VGTAGFARRSGLSPVALADVAVAAALEDCGLDRSEVDGLITHIGSPRGADYDTLAHTLGLYVRFAGQTWAHGRFTATVLQHAAMALSHGLADHVLCVATFRNSIWGKHGSTRFPDHSEAMRTGGGPHAEDLTAGLAAPMGGAALATQRYLHTYSVDPAKIGAVALAQRRAAGHNPAAVLRTPLDLQTYLDSPYVVEPLRRLDCSVPVDTAVAVVLARPDRARDLAQPPVDMIGMQGLPAGPDEFVFAPPGLGVAQVTGSGRRAAGTRTAVFRQTGLGPDDIDTLHCYDGFTTQVLWTLERFGFCKDGEAADWVQGGRIELDGDLPTNTSGGHLSEGHSNGWGQTMEIVRQLRGQAGERQVAGCATAMWATTFGDAIIYGR